MSKIMFNAYNTIYYKRYYFLYINNANNKFDYILSIQPCWKKEENI